MLQVAGHILRNPEDKTKVSLVFCNQTEDDILLKAGSGLPACTGLCMAALIWLLAVTIAQRMRTSRGLLQAWFLHQACALSMVLQAGAGMHQSSVLGLGCLQRPALKLIVHIGVEPDCLPCCRH